MGGCGAVEPPLGSGALLVLLGLRAMTVQSCLLGASTETGVKAGPPGLFPQENRLCANGTQSPSGIHWRGAAWASWTRGL